MGKVVSLCPACSNCPTVELRDEAIYIGEGTNLVKLRVDEWNMLVRAVKQGTLDEVKSRNE